MMLPDAGLVSHVEQPHSLNAEATVAVATDYFWLPISANTHVGAKLQLLGQGGVAIYGVHNPKETFFTHWAPLPKRLRPGASSHQFRGRHQESSLNSDSMVVVATDYYWIPVGPHTPVGAKLQLLGLGGVAIYGAYSPKDKFFTHWAPLPKRRPR